MSWLYIIKYNGNVDTITIEWSHGDDETNTMVFEYIFSYDLNQIINNNKTINNNSEYINQMSDKIIKKIDYVSQRCQKSQNTDNAKSDKNSNPTDVTVKLYVELNNNYNL